MRGSILDNIVIMVIVFIFAFGSLIAYVIYDSFNKEFSKYYPEITNQTMNDMPLVFSIFDFGVLTMLILFGISSIALASRIKTHPVFFIISFILFLISIIIAYLYSNIFEMLTHYSIFDVAFAYMSTTLNIMLQYSMIFTVIGLLILLSMYVKLYETYTYGR